MTRRSRAEVRRLGVGVLLLLGCHPGAARTGPEPCRPGAEASEEPVSAASLAGEYRLQLTPDSAAGPSVEGVLRLVPADSSLLHRPGPFGIPDTMHRYPLVGTVEVDLAAVGAVAPGGTTSTDPSTLGVVVIERVGGRPVGERILIRLSTTDDQAEPVRFDGGYTVLRVRRIELGSFRGEWESGAPMPQVHGYFCAVRSSGTP